MAKQRSKPFVDQEWNNTPDQEHNGCSPLEAMVRYLARKAAEADFLIEQGFSDSRDLEDEQDE